MMYTARAAQKRSSSRPKSVMVFHSGSHAMHCFGKSRRSKRITSPIPVTDDRAKKPDAGDRIRVRLSEAGGE